MDIDRKYLRPLASLLWAVLIAWAFLALAIWQLLGSVQLDVLRVAGTVVTDALQAPPVQRQIAAFIGAQLLIHTGLGVVIWILALASVRCYPRFSWPTVGWGAVLCGMIHALNASLFPGSAFASIHDFVTVPLLGTSRSATSWSLRSARWR